MAEQDFEAIALRKHIEQVSAVESGSGVQEIDLDSDEHVSLDVEGDLKRATAEQTVPPASASAATKAAAVDAVLGGVTRKQSTTATAAAAAATTPAPAKKPGRRSSDYLQTRATDRSARVAGDTRRKHHIAHAVWLAVFAVTAFACWGAISPAWVRLRENVVTPIATVDPTDDPNMKFHNTYTSVGGLMVVLNYLPIVRLFSAIVYFGTCLLPATCGGRLLPWNWHNEKVFLANYAQECNPTYWIWLAWASAVGCAEAGILLQIHDEWLLIALATLAASAVYILQFTELENAGSPNSSKDQRAFWLAFVPWIVKYIILWRGYRLASTATKANGEDFHFPEWIFFAALMYLLPELLHLLLVGFRLWKCCGMESYAKFANNARWLTAISQLGMAITVSAGLHYL